MSDENIFVEQNEDNYSKQDKLDMLVNLCDQYKRQLMIITALENNLKAEMIMFEKISRELIPEILNEVGLSELKLSTGEKIIVKDQLKSSIADKNYLQAYQNMIAAEGGDADAKEKVDGLFKSKAIIENPDDQILNNLIEKQVPYDLKREIHWQTLQKYCKNKLDRGEKIPEGISVFTYSETVIK